MISSKKDAQEDFLTITYPGMGIHVRKSQFFSSMIFFQESEKTVWGQWYQSSQQWNGMHIPVFNLGAWIEDTFQISSGSRSGLCIITRLSSFSDVSRTMLENFFNERKIAYSYAVGCLIPSHAEIRTFESRAVRQLTLAASEYLLSRGIAGCMYTGAEINFLLDLEKLLVQAAVI